MNHIERLRSRFGINENVSEEGVVDRIINRFDDLKSIEDAIPHLHESKKRILFGLSMEGTGDLRQDLERIADAVIISGSADTVRTSMLKAEIQKLERILEATKLSEMKALETVDRLLNERDAVLDGKLESLEADLSTMADVNSKLMMLLYQFEQALEINTTLDHSSDAAAAVKDRLTKLSAELYEARCYKSLAAYVRRTFYPTNHTSPMQPMESTQLAMCKVNELLRFLEEVERITKKIPPETQTIEARIEIALAATRVLSKHQKPSTFYLEVADALGLEIGDGLDPETSEETVMNHLRQQLCLLQESNEAWDQVDEILGGEKNWNTVPRIRELVKERDMLRDARDQAYALIREAASVADVTERDLPIWISRTKRRMKAIQQIASSPLSEPIRVDL